MKQMARLYGQGVSPLALDEKPPIGKRLANVMNKGGRAKCLSAKYQTLEELLEEHEGWDDPETAPTIFNGGCPKKVEPIYRVQESDSPNCHFLARSRAINCATSTLDTSKPVFRNRCMRNIFPKKHLFQFIFLGDGGCCDETLYELVGLWNVGKTMQDLTSTILMHKGVFTKNRQLLFDVIKISSKLQGPGVIKIRVF